MLELVVLFAFAALGSFFRSEEEERMSAVPVPAGPMPEQDRRGERAPAMRRPVAFEPAGGPADGEPAANSSVTSTARARADEAYMADLGARLAAEARQRPNPEPLPRDTMAADSTGDDALWAGDDALFGEPETRSETSPATATEGQDDEQETIVVVLPADYTGPGAVSLRDAPTRDGRPAAHVLIDGQVVAELAGTRAADIPLDSISVVEDETEQAFA